MIDPRRSPPPPISRLSAAVVGIAASAGGPAALAVVLPGMTDLGAPILVVQHLHPRFVDGFVRWMRRVSALPVEMGADGVKLRPGVVYIGPHGVHLRLGAGRTLVLDADPPMLHRPSADELFRSMAAHAGTAGIGVILTGMGDDGAAGLRELRLAGGTTLAQDRATTAVNGMPAAARELGAIDQSVPLPRIAHAIHDAVRARCR